MALTGTLAVSPTGGKAGQPATVTLTLTNTGATAINILSVQPTKSSLANMGQNQVPVALGLPPYLPGDPITVAPNSASTLSMSWGAVAWGSGAAAARDQASPTFFLGAVVRYTDGSTTAELIPTPCEYTMLSYPNTIDVGELDFSDPGVSSFIPVVL